jgi:thiamine monophosphate kinase
MSRIGRITAASGLRLLDGAGREMVMEERGFDHFAA